MVQEFEVVPGPPVAVVVTQFADSSIQELVNGGNMPP